jgi:hypothetical protein
MPRHSESNILIPVVESKDYGSAGIDFDSVHIGRLNSLSIAINFGLLTGNSILKVSTGATEGVKTTDIAFKYRIGGGAFKAASADILGDPIAVASTGLTLTAATFQHKLVVIEIDADNGTDGQPWVTVSIDATATVLNVGGLGVGWPRHASHTPLTVVK